MCGSARSRVFAGMSASPMRMPPIAARNRAVRDRRRRHRRRQPRARAGRSERRSPVARCANSSRRSIWFLLDCRTQRCRQPRASTLVQRMRERRRERGRAAPGRTRPSRAARRAPPMRRRRRRAPRRLRQEQSMTVELPHRPGNEGRHSQECRQVAKIFEPATSRPPCLRGTAIRSAQRLPTRSPGRRPRGRSRFRAAPRSQPEPLSRRCCPSTRATH